MCVVMQIKTAHPLAITYNDQSPLENHHHAAATRVWLQPEFTCTPVWHCSSVHDCMHDSQ